MYIKKIIDKKIENYTEITGEAKIILNLIKENQKYVNQVEIRMVIDSDDLIETIKIHVPYLLNISHGADLVFYFDEEGRESKLINMIYSGGKKNLALNLSDAIRLFNQYIQKVIKVRDTLKKLSEEIK